MPATGSPVSRPKPTRRLYTFAGLAAGLIVIAVVDRRLPPGNARAMAFGVAALIALVVVVFVVGTAVSNESKRKAAARQRRLADGQRSEADPSDGR